MKKIVLVSGGFDPVHSGHIAYLAEAKKLGNELWVALNSDAWLTRKKGRPFMDFENRHCVLSNLSMVDRVFAYNDNNNSATAAIFHALSSTSGKLIFANGGDRTRENIPEMITFGDHPDVEFVFGVGGEDKKNSSSWVLDSWKTHKTQRSWGYWRILDDKPELGVKVKELVIEPGKSLSNQRHRFRSEHWYVLSGEITMTTEYNNIVQDRVLKEHNTYIVDPLIWHCASNNTDKLAHVIEVQYGTVCDENDIERK